MPYPFPTQPTSPTDKPSTQNNSVSTLPDLCLGNFDAVGTLRGDVFIFKGDYVWRLNSKLKSFDGYPIQWRDLFTSLPDDVKQIDAVYERAADSAIIIFSGKQFWVYDGHKFIENSPQPLAKLGLPVTLERLDAAMVWGNN